MGEDAARRVGAFFGRRKGKKLRQGQADLVETLLPRLRLDPAAGLPNVAALFPGHPTQVWLEIGFGGGEHLVSRARAHRDVGIIGCEPFVNGMAKLLAVIDDEGLDNVRLYDGDAGEVIDSLPPACLERVYLLYPDPWPKRRHNKRRFVSDAMLVRLARVMRPGAQFCFASDIDHYVGWTLRRIQRSPDFRWTAQTARDWREPFAGWPGTRYEAKAVREGRPPSYITAVRV
jgi:tRNA (guanine-N7-)-methyltransferase